MTLDDTSRKSDESRVAYPLPPGEIDGTLLCRLDKLNPKSQRNRIAAPR